MHGVDAIATLTLLHIRGSTERAPGVRTEMKSITPYHVLLSTATCTFEDRGVANSLESGPRNPPQACPALTAVVHNCLVIARFAEIATIRLQ